jgi:ribosomal protein S18 acetylase RimI-like enzyme
MALAIRPYHPSDLYALYRVCLLTGDSGKDASDHFRDPELLGHFYTAPYAVLEPDLCFVLTHDGAPCGYVLGARDSATFSARCESEWFPVLRQRYPLPDPGDTTEDAQMIRHIHEGYHPIAGLEGYPAHLHIDLLPVAQRQGWGSKVMETFLDRLRALEAPGVHLGVGKRNTGAIQFYQRVGFEKLHESTGGILFGMRL